MVHFPTRMLFSLALFNTCMCGSPYMWSCWSDRAKCVHAKRSLLIPKGVHKHRTVHACSASSTYIYADELHIQQTTTTGLWLPTGSDNRAVKGDPQQLVVHRDKNLPHHMIVAFTANHLELGLVGGGGLAAVQFEHAIAAMLVRMHE